MKAIRLQFGQSKTDHDCRVDLPHRHGIQRTEALYETLSVNGTDLVELNSRLQGIELNQI
jgi:hypothetical protein